MTPSIYIDFKNPASYLALTPTCALLERLDIQARWLPFSTSEETIPDRKTEESRGEQHRRVRARSRRQTHQLYADLQGVEMTFPATPGSTETCLAALALLEDRDPLPFIRAAFNAYWIEAADLDEEKTVCSLWSSTVGSEAPDLMSGRQALETIREAAIENKVFHAPTYRVGDHLFVGREHLPWIETLLRQSD